MKRAERMQDRGAVPRWSTIRVSRYLCDGPELGSTGAESEWRQTGWFRKNQIKLSANNYVAPSHYALAA